MIKIYDICLVFFEKMGEDHGNHRQRRKYRDLRLGVDQVQQLRRRSEVQGLPFSQERTASLRPKKKKEMVRNNSCVEQIFSDILKNILRYYFCVFFFDVMFL